MNYFIDTEFYEDGRTIDLISIAIVPEEGDKYLYCVSNEYNHAEAWQNKWLRENVLRDLLDTVPYCERIPRWRIKNTIIEFLKDDDKPIFYGYYADYDWVVFCRLFGRMIDLPEHFPMYCRDLKQYKDGLGNPSFEDPQGEHDALNDALWNRSLYQYLQQKETGR